MIREFIKNIKKILPLIKDNKKSIVILVVLSLLTTVISIISPALISKIITSIVNKEYIVVVYVLLVLGFIKIVDLLSGLLNSKCFFALRIDFILKMKKKISDSVLSLDIKTFSTSGKGKFIQRINNDPNTIADCLYDIKTIFIVFLSNAGVLIYVFYLNFYIGCIYILFLILILLFRNNGLQKKYNYRNKLYKEQEKINSELTEMFNGMKDVKQLNMKSSFIKKTNNSFDNYEKLKFNSDFTLDLYVKLSVVLEWIASAIAILLGLLLLNRELMVVDTFITLFMYRKNIFQFSSCFTDLLDRLYGFNLSTQRVFEIINYANDKKENNEDIECLGKIEFKNVCFKYDRQNVLKGCSFTINPNETVALVGRSGSGKTTILNLISKIYDINSGEILIDDKNIEEYSEKFLRKNISVISQNYYLFDMSIKDNLLLVKPELTDKEMIKICKKVDIHSFIMSLPDKYNTIIGEGGFTLSGGQRQRLAIARALLLNSKIMLFDEVTNSLDSLLEDTIYSVIEKLGKNHTIVVVSHKQNIVNKINISLSLKDGKII